MFTEVLRDWNQSAAPPSVDETKVIAKRALSAPHGRNPNDTAAYEFLALYPLIVSGHGMKLTPSLIRNSLSTLAKRGIPPKLRSRSESQPK